MFNVLPDNLKSNIRSQYNLRRIIVFLNIVVFAQIFLLVSLLPSWFVSFYIENNAGAEVAGLEQDKLKGEVVELSTEINSLNNKLALIKSIQTGYSPTHMTKNIIDQKNSAVYINEITYTKSGDNEVGITIKGVGGDRESLQSFVKKLESSKLFTKVDSPLSNFTKDTNISFSLFLSMNIQNEKQ